ncbi:hypothetical protein HMI55_002887 [Coelomomyces lativittatus]|nr:hypothetical protein HMI55_002887 [Coelomomyces lativittatus]
MTDSATPFPWSIQHDLELLRALTVYRPIGLHAHFRILAIQHLMIKPLKMFVSTESIWYRLNELYDLKLLEQIDSEIILKEDLESHKPWTQVTEFQVPLEWLEQTFQNKSNAGTSKLRSFRHRPLSLSTTLTPSTSTHVLQHEEAVSMNMKKASLPSTFLSRSMNSRSGSSPNEFPPPSTTPSRPSRTSNLMIGSTSMSQKERGSSTRHRTRHPHGSRRQVTLRSHDPTSSTSSRMLPPALDSLKKEPLGTLSVPSSIESKKRHDKDKHKLKKPTTLLHLRTGTLPSPKLPSRRVETTTPPVLQKSEKPKQSTEKKQGVDLNRRKTEPSKNRNPKVGI